MPVQETKMIVLSDAAARYLDLLKRALTDTVFTNEPNPDDPVPAQYMKDHITHYIRGHAVSMLPLARLDALQHAIVDVLRQGIAGDVIETGAWRGGTTIFMRAVLAAYEVTDRRVWVADSFEGLPRPDPVRFPTEARIYDSGVMKMCNHLAVGLDEVRANFERFGLLDEQVVFLKGWFKDTLPQAPIDRLAILRLDGDYYESTMDGLANLYDKLSLGGYVIVDDYGEDTWTNCRQATDDFRRSRNITEPMSRVDSKCYFWRRTALGHG
jgi:Macrocin-O-methyltransferase (TylF)